MPPPSGTSPNSRLGFHQHFPSNTGYNSFVESFTDKNLCAVYRSVLFSVDSKIVSTVGFFCLTVCAMPSGREKISLKEGYVTIMIIITSLYFVLYQIIIHFFLVRVYFIYIALYSSKGMLTS